MRCKFLLVLILLASAPSCSKAIEVGLEGDTQPTFSLSGGGKVWSLEIYEITKNADGGRCFCLAWRIEAWGETLAVEGRRAGDIKAIKYGVAPEGFRQTYPLEGPPLPIVPGKQYEHRFVMKGGYEDKGRFEIMNGKLTFTMAD